MRTLADRLEEQAKADADDRDLTSRSDLRREQNARETALKELARRLVALKLHQLERLELEEKLLEAIHTARALPNPGARNRQISVVRQHLRDMGSRVSVIENRLAGGPGAGALAGRPTPPPSRALGWMERLVNDGDEALDELCRERPSALRQELRQQVRAVARARTGADIGGLARAERRLRLALESLLEPSIEPS